MKRVKLSRSTILPLEIVRVDGDNCTSVSLGGGAVAGSKGRVLCKAKVTQTLGRPYIGD